MGALAHAAANVPIVTQHATPVRTLYLTVLAYNIMTLTETIAPKATGLSFFGIPGN
jgi:hypothetical protein